LTLLYDPRHSAGTLTKENDMVMSLEEYLNQPCDEEGCTSRATNINAGRKVCSTHTDYSKDVRAMND
jgi:hypothetical protein